ncbi:RebB family R body protein [Celerinatantimonas sp. YJH-8]|uniref:RebB family R body protein n=1 Tax=Celerinatantimonas sp. YJH-8 TaxID=3228714 RepID=UPI0038C20F59
MPMNEVVTDSVTQVNTQVIGDTPAMAEGNLFMATSQALGITALNSIGANQQGTIVHQTATVQGVNSLFATNVAILGRGVEAIDGNQASKKK